MRRPTTRELAARRRDRGSLAQPRVAYPTRTPRTYQDCPEQQFGCLAPRASRSYVSRPKASRRSGRRLEMKADRDGPTPPYLATRAPAGELAQMKSRPHARYLQRLGADSDLTRDGTLLRQYGDDDVTVYVCRQASASIRLCGPRLPNQSSLRSSVVRRSPDAGGRGVRIAGHRQTCNAGQRPQRTMEHQPEPACARCG